MALELARWDDLGDEEESVAALAPPKEIATSQPVRGLPRMRLRWQRREETMALP